MGKVNVPEEFGFIAKGLFAILILFILVFWGALIISDSKSTFSDAFYESIGIVTHGNIPDGIHSYFLMVLSLAGVVINFYIFYLIFDFILEGRMNKIVRGVKHMGIINNLKNHYIICGGGRVGFNVAKELVKNGKKTIIIEKDSSLFEPIENAGIPLLKGNAIDETNLKKVNIEKAKFLIACLDSDGDNILLTLTAKELNPTIKVGARAMDEQIVKKLHHAGADYVVLPEVVGGLQLAKSVLNE